MNARCVSDVRPVLRRAAAWLLIVLLGALSTPVLAAQKLLHAQRSLYREVLVYQQANERCMCFTRECRIGRQTCVDLRHPDQFVMNYPRMMMSALYVQPAPKSILIIGLGGGTLPRALAQALPGARIDVVE